MSIGICGKIQVSAFYIKGGCEFYTTFRLEKEKKGWYTVHTKKEPIPDKKWASGHSPRIWKTFFDAGILSVSSLTITCKDEDAAHNQS